MRQPQCYGVPSLEVYHAAIPIASLSQAGSVGDQMAKSVSIDYQQPWYVTWLAYCHPEAVQQLAQCMLCGRNPSCLSSGLCDTHLVDESDEACTSSAVLLYMPTWRALTTSGCGQVTCILMRSTHARKPLHAVPTSPSIIIQGYTTLGMVRQYHTTWTCALVTLPIMA